MDVELNSELPIVQRLTEIWNRLAETPNVFRYQLNIVQSKCLPGKFSYLCQLNPDRTTKRRPPQSIVNMLPTFSETEFNFNKVNPDEIMFKVNHGDTLITFLVNNSPLTLYHSLICPDLTANHAQILTEPSVEYALELLQHLPSAYRVGYNSPGACASVNHLHLHLVHIEQQLYIDTVSIAQIRSNLHRIHSSTSPTSGFVFRATHANPARRVAADVMKLVRFMCSRQIAHNLFFTRGQWADAEPDEVRVFVFARHHMGAVKEFSTFNVGFCELSGFVPVGNLDTFEALTEEGIVTKIRAEIGEIADSIADEVAALYV